MPELDCVVIGYVPRILPLTGDGSWVTALLTKAATATGTPPEKWPTSYLLFGNTGGFAPEGAKLLVGVSYLQYNVNVEEGLLSGGVGEVNICPEDGLGKVVKALVESAEGNAPLAVIPEQMIVNIKAALEKEGYFLRIKGVKGI